MVRQGSLCESPITNFLRNRGPEKNAFVRIAAADVAALAVSWFGRTVGNTKLKIIKAQTEMNV